jgi:hypothetical protein
VEFGRAWEHMQKRPRTEAVNLSAEFASTSLSVHDAAPRIPLNSIHGSKLRNVLPRINVALVLHTNRQTISDTRFSGSKHKLAPHRRVTNRMP